MRPLRRLRAAARLVAITALVLVVLEGGLRALGVKPHGGVLLSADDCYFGWEPDARDRHSKGDLGHDVVTDALGFRVERPGERPGDEPGCSVLALGDSFTEGLYVPASQAWPAVAEALLEERGYRVRVRNGGMRGHTIHQERIAALARWEAVKPTVTIVAHTANDLMDLGNAEAHGCVAGGPLPTSFRSAIPPALRSLSLLRVAQELGIRFGAWRGAAGAAGSPIEPVGPGGCARLQADYVTEAGLLADGARASGGRLLLVLWEPLWCADGTPEGVTLSPSALQARLAGSGGALLETPGVLARPDATLRPRDSHPSPLGQRLFAERVVAALEESGWLAGCATAPSPPASAPPPPPGGSAPSPPPGNAGPGAR